MTEAIEQPLVGWGEIANFLKLSVYSTKKLFKVKDIDYFYMLRFVTIYPSTLKKQLENNSLKVNTPRRKQRGI